jgi:hypothetical protein
MNYYSSQQKNITCILPIEQLDFIVTGSNDTYIRLYDFKV